MKICVSFRGQPRTFEKTFENLSKNLFRESDEYTIIFTTWDTEDTSIITKNIPSAIINKIKEPTKEEFNEWFLEHKPLNYFILGKSIYL